MRIKIFRCRRLEDIERDINLFLCERKDIKIININELRTHSDWAFILIYEIKDGEK